MKALRKIQWYNAWQNCTRMNLVPIMNTFGRISSSFDCIIHQIIILTQGVDFCARIFSHVWTYYQFNSSFVMQLFFYGSFYVWVPGKKSCCHKTIPLPRWSRNHGGRWFVLAPPWSDRRAACANRFLTSWAIGWAYYFSKNNCQQFGNCSFVWCY